MLPAEVSIRCRYREQQVIVDAVVTSQQRDADVGLQGLFDHGQLELHGVVGSGVSLRPGDTLLVHSIDRLCRNVSDMCAVTTRLRDQGVTLIFLKEQLTFSAAKKSTG